MKRGVIACFIKTQLNLSYKKCSSSPILKELLRLKALGKVYAIEFAYIIDSSKLIVNIDEVVFSKSTKINYSWISKGYSKFWNNTSFTRSLSLILSITNQGDWYTSNSTSLNNTYTFVDYIVELIKWLRIDLKKEMNEIFIILDNCLVHKSKWSLKQLNEYGCRVSLLPAYSPDFAPVELLFNSLKRKLSVQEKGISVNLNSEVCLRSIKEWMMTFSRSEIISYWISALRRISWSLSNDANADH